MELREIAKFLEQTEVRPLIDLIRKERPYKTPKGYIKWDTLSAILACCIVNRNAPNIDDATRLNSFKCTLWFVQDAPIYALSIDLLKAFENSDVFGQSELFAALEPPLRTFMILFPQGFIRTPDYDHLDWAVVHFADRTMPGASAGSAFGIEIPAFAHDHERNLHWSGVCNQETVWFSGSGLTEDGKIVHSDETLGSCPLSHADREFLAKMRSIVLQCLLALSFAPELIDEPIQLSGAPQQPVRKYSAKPLTRSVRWLGKNYKLPKRSNCYPGDRQSPRGHWRKAHSRRVAVGEGRQLREWRWFPATWVGSEVR